MSRTVINCRRTPIGESYYTMNERMCGDCLYFHKAKPHMIQGENHGGRLCPAIQMAVYPMVQACDSFDHK